MHEKLAEYESLKQDHVLLKEFTRGVPQPARPQKDAAQTQTVLQKALSYWQHGPLERRLSTPPDTPHSPGAQESSTDGVSNEKKCRANAYANSPVLFG